MLYLSVIPHLGVYKYMYAPNFVYSNQVFSELNPKKY